MIEYGRYEEVGDMHRKTSGQDGPILNVTGQL